MRHYLIIRGSVPYYEERAAEIGGVADTLADMVIEHDRFSNAVGPRFIPTDRLLVPNNNYLCITEQAHSRLGSLIEDVTTDDAEILVHNPTSQLEQHIRIREREGRASVEQTAQDYRHDEQTADLQAALQSVRESIIGQDDAIAEIVSSLLYLSKSSRTKPFVFMLYGKSSLGKTETARTIAKAFFGGNMIEKHLSMFETETYANYLFGGKPNTNSLGYDLYERLSNLVFLDEIDKCAPLFHSAFYSLFDSQTYIDSTYRVNISGLVIILTCNYLTMSDIHKNLGSPIFYRIDKFIPFNDFSAEAIHKITLAEIHNQLEQVSAPFSPEDVYRIASRTIKSSGENGRTIQTKVREAIEQLLMKKNGVLYNYSQH